MRLVAVLDNRAVASNLRKTAALKSLNRNLDRAKLLVDHHFGNRQGRGHPEREAKDALRLVVVLAIGALDAYLSDVTVDVLSGAPPKPVSGRSIWTLLRDEHKPSDLDLIEAVFADSKRAVVRSKLVADLRERTFHGAEWVVRLANMLDLPFDKTASLRGHNIGDHLDTVGKWVQPRHKIVHQGKTPLVKRDDARALIVSVRAVGEHFDALACKRIRDASRGLY